MPPTLPKLSRVATERAFAATNDAIVNSVGIGMAWASLKNAKADDHLDLIEDIIDAAITMEGFRRACGRRSFWGGDLPPLFDAWDAIVRLLRSDPKPTTPLYHRVYHALITLCKEQPRG